MSTCHVVLSGDSIFDNLPYLGPGEPDVAEQVRQRLLPGERVTRLALDGSMVADVPRQLERLPKDATHVVVSVGGNDALRCSPLFDEPAANVGEAFERMAEVADEFRRGYRSMLDAVLSSGLPTVICTIYDPRFELEDSARLAELGMQPLERAQRTRFQRSAQTALSIFNDVIARSGSERGVPLIELRSVFCDDADYANPIEPSALGGAKLADRIVATIREADFAARRTAVFC